MYCLSKHKGLDCVPQQSFVFKWTDIRTLLKDAETLSLFDVVNEEDIGLEMQKHSH